MTLTIDTPVALARSTRRQAADAFADSVGEDRTSVRVLDPKWLDLLKAGARVDIHCTRWRAVTTLTLEDLGIEPASGDERQAWEAVLALGNRYLLPKHVVDGAQSIENRFRGVLWRNSYKTHWGYFVPQQKYVAWRAEATAIKAEYAEFAQHIYDGWTDLTAQVAAEYRAIGHQNYWRLVNAGRQPTDHGQNEWTEAFVKRCMRRLEGREYVRDSFSMTWDVAYIPLASMLAEDDAEAARVAAIAQAKTEMEKDILQDAATLFQNGLQRFVADVQGELHNRVFNVCCDALAAIERNDGELPRNSSKQLKNLVDAVQGLKFWDDAQLDSQMNTIKSMMDVRYDKRDGAAVTQALKRIGAEARLVLGDLNRVPERRSAHIGIPEGDGLGRFVRQGRTLDAGTFELPTEQPIMRRARRSIAVGND